MTRVEYIDIMGALAGVTERLNRLQRDVNGLRELELESLNRMSDLRRYIDDLERRTERRLDERTAWILDEQV